MQRVLALRLTVGWSIRELGRQIGISYSTLARLERGEGTPDDITMERLNKWLKGEPLGALPEVNTVRRKRTWSAGMEKRLAALESRVKGLEEIVSD